MVVNKPSRETKTWREIRHNVQPLQSEAIFFDDTYPNHILVSNPSSYQLYIGLSGAVNPQFYDVVVPPYATKLHARAMGTNRLYVYSESVEEIQIQVTSWEGEFNPASISQSMEMVGTGSDGLLGIVEINNIMNPLPSGENIIGGIVVSRFDESLPSGNNLLGRIQIDEVPPMISKQIIMDSSGIFTVKAGAGFVYAIHSSIPVQVLDNGIPIWVKDNFNFANPIKIERSLQVSFDQEGEAFILYR